MKAPPGIAIQQGMPMQISYPEAFGPSRTLWTGPLVLEFRSGRDWSVGDADLTIGRDTVQLRHANRCLAILDRDVLRQWLLQAEPEPLAVDDIVWSVQTGSTWIAIGSTMFWIIAESRSSTTSGQAWLRQRRAGAGSPAFPL